MEDRILFHEWSKDMQDVEIKGWYIYLDKKMQKVMSLMHGSVFSGETNREKYQWSENNNTCTKKQTQDGSSLDSTFVNKLKHILLTVHLRDYQFKNNNDIMWR